MINGKTIGMVTTCMGRENVLKSVMFSWERLMPFVDRIVIVDWSNDQPITIKETKAEIIRVSGNPCFNQSKAQNTGIRYLDTDWIFAIDCDVAVQAYDQVYSKNPGFIKLIEPELKPGNFITRNNSPNTDGALTGTMIFEKSAWEKVGGFPENVIGWGYQDVSLLGRLEMAGFKPRHFFDEKHLFHIPHTNQKRLENYSFRTPEKWFSMLVNRFITTHTDYTKQVQQKQVCTVVDGMGERMLHV